MTTSLTELIVSLRKLNPTFTDEIIRGHLINLGNSKEAVEDALRVVNGGGASEIIQNADRDMSKGVVFEEDTIRQKSGFDVINSQNNKLVLKRKHHLLRNIFILIVLMIVLIMGLMFSIGSLTLGDFKNINVEWDKISSIDYLKKESSFFLKNSYSKINQTIGVIKSKFIFTKTPLMEENLFISNENSGIVINDPEVIRATQIKRVNKVRSALNAYVAVYGKYPTDLLDMTKENVDKNKVQLPLLTVDDISDSFSKNKFVYKIDPKLGFYLSYSMEVPTGAVKSGLFYDLVDYRLVYNTKTKSSSYVPILRYVNGLNTATRDIISIEAVKLPQTDLNKNLIPDSLD